MSDQSDFIDDLKALIDEKRSFLNKTLLFVYRPI